MQAAECRQDDDIEACVKEQERSCVKVLRRALAAACQEECYLEEYKEYVEHLTEVNSEAEAVALSTAEQDARQLVEAGRPVEESAGESGDPYADFFEQIFQKGEPAPDGLAKRSGSK